MFKVLCVVCYKNCILFTNLGGNQNISVNIFLIIVFCFIFYC